MDRKLYKELWRMRFEKMLKLEEQAVVDYQELLDECRSKHEQHPIEPHLECLIKDETKHARLVRELLSIVEKQPVNSIK